jgi:hypothetical protein
MGGDDYVIDGDLAFSNKSDALKFYQEQYHKKKEWQGLTDEEAEEVERWVEFKEEGSGRIPTGKLIRYIEAKLKEKNG